MSSLRTPLQPNAWAQDDATAGAGKNAKRGRLVDRGDDRGYNIKRVVNRRLKRITYANDWFHTIVHLRSHRIVAAVVLSYLLLYFFFAGLYLLASGDDCFPELTEPVLLKNGTIIQASALRRFARALFFSIETLMTIGYGIDDWQTVADCPLLLMLIGAQSLTGIFTSSILFGIVLARIGRAETRARTIAFSERAIVRAAYGQLYLVLRVCEMRKHQLAQATVRAYAINDSGEVIERK